VPRQHVRLVQVPLFQVYLPVLLLLLLVVLVSERLLEALLERTHAGEAGTDGGWGGGGVRTLFAVEEHVCVAVVEMDVATGDV